MSARAPTATALHACSYCHRHPSTNPTGGEDACPGCGLGDDVDESGDEGPGPDPRAATAAARRGACLPAGTITVRP